MLETPALVNVFAVWGCLGARNPCPCRCFRRMGLPGSSKTSLLSMFSPPGAAWVLENLALADVFAAWAFENLAPSTPLEAHLADLSQKMNNSFIF